MPVSRRVVYDIAVRTMANQFSNFELEWESEFVFHVLTKAGVKLGTGGLPRGYRDYPIGDVEALVNGRIASVMRGVAQEPETLKGNPRAKELHERKLREAAERRTRETERMKTGNE